jgi:hypothetical protein
MADFKAFSIVIFCLAFLVFLCIVILLGIITFSSKRRAEQMNVMLGDQAECGEEEQLHSTHSGNPLDENGLVSRSTL